jgi:hypothetical protein
MMLSLELKALVDRVASALQKQAMNFTETGATPIISAANLEFTKVIDPFNQQPAYDGIWRDAGRYRCGSFSINSDQSFYAEYDLFCAHPRDTRWFVEMVTAWGNAEKLRCEVKLIPSL